MRTLIIILWLSAPLAVSAGTTAVLEEGMTASLDGVDVSLLVQGKPVWTAAIAAGEAAGDGRLEVHQMADDLSAVHVVRPLKSGGVSEAVLIKTRGRTDVKVIWNEETSLEGDIGERTGKAVRFQDLTGDGKPEIVTGSIYEMVRLCGQEALPLLFREVYDPKNGVFRSVLAKRPGVTAPKDLLGAPLAETPRTPLIEPLSPASASRSPGDGGTVIGLAMPQEVLDRDPATAWTPFPRNGAGEFVTFRIVSDAYGVTRVGIRPLPDPGKKRRKIAFDRPKTLLLLTENGAFRLTLETDPAAAPASVFWFDLPEPVKTHCMSLVVETSFDPSDKRLLPIAEIFAETEIDGPDGVARLAADLKSDDRRRQAAMLLERFGPEGAAAIRTVWPDLDIPGKRLAVEILTKTAPAKSVGLLVEAVLGDDERIRETAMRGLAAVPEAAVAGLAKHLGSKDRAVFEVAATTLVSLDVPASLEALVAATGAGDRGRRRLLRSLLSYIAARADERAEALLAYLVAAEGAGDREKMFDLLRAGAAAPVLGDRIHAIAGRVFDSSETFADRYRALEALGKLRCDLPRKRLLAAATNNDKLIRKVAVEGLGVCDKPSAAMQEALRRALDDPEPLVRLAGLDALIRIGLAGVPFDRIRALSESDPWPEVRAKTVALATRLPPEQAFQLLRGVADDASAMVREAVLDSVVPLPGEAADALVERRLADENEASRIKLKAAVAAGRRCQETAVPHLLQVLKIGAEPLAKKEYVEVAVAAAKALGAIGGERAAAALKEARRHSNPATDKAIDSAIEENGAFCKAKKKTPAKRSSK